MEWSRAAFTAFGAAENAYTKNPTTTTREEQSQEWGKDWQDKKQKGWWSHKEADNHNYNQWYNKAKKTWNWKYSAVRHSWGPKPGWAAGEPYWSKKLEPYYNQSETPYEPCPAKEVEEREAASSSGYVKPRPSSRAVALSDGKGEEEPKESQEPATKKKDQEAQTEARRRRTRTTRRKSY
jgi:hypothetical protein